MRPVGDRFAAGPRTRRPAARRRRRQGRPGCTSGRRAGRTDATRPRTGGGTVGVPLRYVVLVEHPALGVRYEPQVAPGLAHVQPAVPGVAGADAAGDQGFGGAVPGEGGDDQVAVGADEVHACQFVAQAVDHTVGDGLQRVGQAARGVHVRHHLVQLPQCRQTDVGLRIGFHSPSPEISWQLQAPGNLLNSRAYYRLQFPLTACSFPATESQREAHSVHRVNKIWLL